MGINGSGDSYFLCVLWAATEAAPAFILAKIQTTDFKY